MAWPLCATGHARRRRTETRDSFTKAANSEDWKKFADSIGSQVRVMGSDEMTDFVADQFKKIKGIVAKMEGGG